MRIINLINYSAYTDGKRSWFLKVTDKTANIVKYLTQQGTLLIENCFKCGISNSKTESRVYDGTDVNDVINRLYYNYNHMN